MPVADHASPLIAPDLTGPGACQPLDVVDEQARVLSNTPVNPEYCHMILATGREAASARAGQFFNIACPQTGTDMPYLRRPMSVYRADAAHGRVEFLYKIAGAGTRGLATLRAGDRVAILGPLGNGFTIESGWKNIVVLGRGVGLATLAPLAELAASQNVGVTAVLSARTRALVMSTERFLQCGADVEIVTDEDGSSDPSQVEKILQHAIDDRHADAFFTCGSNRLMLLMKRIAAAHGIAGQVAMEQQMACGLGMCFCCVRNFEGADGPEQRRVCWDGPVFSLAEALSW